MSDEARALAEHIADEVIKGSWIDREELTDKIVAALIIMRPPESNVNRQIRLLQEKLRDYKKQKKAHSSRETIERRFWKRNATDRMDDWEKNIAYDQLDKELKQQGL